MVFCLLVAGELVKAQFLLFPRWHLLDQRLLLGTSTEIPLGQFVYYLYTQLDLDGIIQQQHEA